MLDLTPVLFRPVKRILLRSDTFSPTLGAMKKSRQKLRYLDAVMIVVLLAVLLFVSPVIYLWTARQSPWYTPYLLWLAIIIAAALAARLRSRHEL